MTRQTWMRTLLVVASIAIACWGWEKSALAAVVYGETFDGATVPGNWFAQNGTAGTATLGIADDAGGINTGNALSISAATRQGTIGSFTQTSFVNVGDMIELSFDVRLTSFPDNAGGFRFGLYQEQTPPDNSSGYRVLLGTGNNVPSADIQADGGDTDIMFGTNRENPVNFASDLGGIADNDSHSFLLRLTRTFDGTDDGVMIEIFQDGASIVETSPIVHITGQGAGTAIPLQTSFNQVAFTTNGGIEGMVDNVQVTFTAVPEPSGIALAACAGVAMLCVGRRQIRRRRSRELSSAQ